MDKSSSVPGTAAFQKFMRALQVVSDQPHSLTIGTLAKTLALPRPTTHRIVEALLAEGMLESDHLDRLGLGPRFVALAWRSLETSDIRAVAQSWLIQLRDALDETVHLAVRNGLEMVYIDKLEAHRTVRMASRVGTRVSLYSSSVGKAWLAAQPLDALDGWLEQLDLRPFTEHTRVSREAIHNEIATTRQRGYAIDDQENELDICCYGCAILDPRGAVAGCISVSMPTYRFVEKDKAATLTVIRHCVNQIHQRLL
ncbi:IclR family transcriptional regulator [Pantoea sp. NPDC088449]|uniref:IclR family transcriptional regulator n=1 Tax=Pantoea sp. NPDC088449 TaxID=3364392 RepID=UPI00382502C9